MTSSFLRDELYQYLTHKLLLHVLFTERKKLRTSCSKFFIPVTIFHPAIDNRIFKSAFGFCRIYDFDKFVALFLNIFECITNRIVSIFLTFYHIHVNTHVQLMFRCLGSTL